MPCRLIRQPIVPTILTGYTRQHNLNRVRPPGECVLCLYVSNRSTYLSRPPRQLSSMAAAIWSVAWRPSSPRTCCRAAKWWSSAARNWTCPVTSTATRSSTWRTCASAATSTLPAVRSTSAPPAASSSSPFVVSVRELCRDMFCKQCRHAPSQRDDYISYLHYLSNDENTSILQ